MGLSSSKAMAPEGKPRDMTSRERFSSEASYEYRHRLTNSFPENYERVGPPGQRKMKHKKAHYGCCGLFLLHCYESGMDIEKPIPYYK